MKRRTIAVVGLVAVLATMATAANSGTFGPSKNQAANSITVWLMEDARQTGRTS